MGERFISFEELAAMSDKELADAALGGSTNHVQFGMLIALLRVERTKAKERLQVK